MKKVLLVDDDALVLRMYQDVLRRDGMEVETANDGLSAIKALRAGKPDVLVLDLMMPKFSGVDVLKFVRSQPELASLPVVVLSNSYMEDLAQGVAAIGAQRALLKARCSPSLLLKTIHELLEGKTSPEEIAQYLPASSPPGSAVVGSPVAGQSRGGLPVFSPADQANREQKAKAREHFSASAAANCAELDRLFAGFEKAPPGQREICLQSVYRKVHFITALAGMADSYRVGQMASVFEALLFHLLDAPDRITPSAIRTMSTTVDFLKELLLQTTEPGQPEPAPEDRALVVDDDRISNRLVAAALREARISVRSTEDPLTALNWLKETRYTLVLLDIIMPSMNGFALCQELRALPGYADIPVIFITSHTEFETFARSRLSGGDDLIAKPILPLELACKVIMHLLRARTRTPNA